MGSRSGWSGCRPRSCWVRSWRCSPIYHITLVGAGLIWIPAAGYLLWQGAYLKVVVLGAVGVVIAVLDYLVRTMVVGGRAHLHTLLVLFSVLGGLTVFGLVGIIAGPLVVAVGITLVESYRAESLPATGSASKASGKGPGEPSVEKG